MVDWATFAGFTGVVLIALLLLSYLSRGIVDADGRVSPPERHAAAEGAAVTRRSPPVDSGGASLPPSVLLVNVALSQGLFGFLLVAGAWYARVPAPALGLGGFSIDAFGVGVALGVTLYLANEIGAALSRRAGFGTAEELRAALAPTSVAGWALLLLVVLPTIAGFEELLFRGALVGALSVGFDVSPWALAVLSSIAFGFGHGAQGPGGVLVTTVLGLVLAGAFVLTGSLFVVFVAHYLVNALEFVVHESLDVDWPRYLIRGGV